MLTEKCKNQEQIIAEYEMREEQYQELEAEADLLRQQSESSRLVITIFSLLVYMDWVN